MKCECCCYNEALWGDAKITSDFSRPLPYLLPLGRGFVPDAAFFAAIPSGSMRTTKEATDT